MRELALHNLTLNYERQHRNYSLEFKKKAVELSHARGSVKQICEELDIPISVLSRWRREPKDYGKNSFPGRGFLF